MLDKNKAVERILRSRWRVTAFRAMPGPHDSVYDEPHSTPLAAFAAALETLAASHPEAKLDDLEYRIVPVHREDA